MIITPDKFDVDIIEGQYCYSYKDCPKKDGRTCYVLGVDKMLVHTCAYHLYSSSRCNAGCNDLGRDE